MTPYTKTNLTPLLAIMLLLAFALGLTGCSAGAAAAQAAAIKTTLSQSALEAQYGLHVNLVAVTAAGGMIDLRLKVTDAEKAGPFMTDAARYPALMVSGSNAILSVPAESRPEEQKLENGGLIMLLFPNTRNAVKPGAEVAVLFGDIRLEPLVVR